jgi:KaiC/GvpD/RAD55 family RecA-like ATPase
MSIVSIEIFLKKAFKTRIQYNYMPKETSKEEAEPQRISSGIHGMDKLIGGGFIPGNTYLITGGTGTGKTIFCCQFMWEGLQKNEPCVYFTLEETPEDIMEDVKEFGWDFKKYIKEKKFIIEFQDPFELADVASLIRSRIEKFGAKRVVIDSTSVFGMIFKDEHEMRKRLYELIKTLKETGAVVMMTSEVPEDMKSLSRFGVEEFIVDGVIILRAMTTGKVSVRTLEVKKMRRTKHDEGTHSIEITKKGMTITD